jgi:hypothetical protein
VITRYKRQGTSLAAAVATAAITAATSLGLATTTPIALASSPCLPQGATIVTENSAGIVYAVDDSVYACSVRTGHGTRLGSSGLGGGRPTVGRVVLAGEYLVYATHTMGVDTGTSELFARWLSTGRVISTASAFPTALGVESSTTIDALVARPSGAYAWIVSGGSIIHPSSFNVGVYEAKPLARSATIKLLDQGPAIAPTSLKLRGTRLSWRHGSEIRQATLD